MLKRLPSLSLAPPVGSEGGFGEWRTLRALRAGLPSLLPPLDCILTLLPQQPSAEDTHVHAETHTVMHKRTYANTRPEVIQSGPLFRQTLLMFLHLCVRVCMLVFPLLSGLKTTELHLPLPPSFSLPLSLGFIFPPSAVVRERQAQPFLQIPGPHLTQTACRRRTPELVPRSELLNVSY